MKVSVDVIQQADKSQESLNSVSRIPIFLGISGQFLTLSVFEITTVQFGFSPLGNFKVMELFVILILE